MNCKTVAGMLSAYLDRELASQERDAVRLHLADCDHCRAEERDLRAFKGLLLGVRAPEPAADFEQRLMSRLREESLRPVRTPLLPRLRPIAWGQLGGLAVAASLAALVILNGPHPVPSAPSAHPREMVAQNVDLDLDAYAQRDEAYARAGDYSAGAPILTSTADAP